MGTPLCLLENLFAKPDIHDQIASAHKITSSQKAREDVGKNLENGNTYMDLKEIPTC